MTAALPATRAAARLATVTLLALIASATSAAASEATCIAAIARANAELRSFTARIRQTKRLALLEEPLVSTGRVAFERPARIAWEIEGDSPMRVVLDGDRVSIPGMNGEDARAMLAPDTLVPQLGALFTGNLEALDDRFEVTAACAEQAADISLAPRSPELAMAVASLALELVGPDLFVRRIRMTNGVGDSLEIALVDVERNVDIPAAAFSVDGDEQ